jgi:hypothetical protein
VTLLSLFFVFSFHDLHFPKYLPLQFNFDMDLVSPSPPPNVYGNSDFALKPYRDYGVIAIGMTGRILQLDESRVVKVVQIFSLDNYTEEDHHNMESSTSINHDILKC